IPADAAAVIVAGPHRALLTPEVESLTRYLRAGGSVALLLEPRAEHGTDELLQSVGIQVNDDVVLDLSPFGTMFGGGPTTAVATEFSEHPITAALRGSNAVFARARSLSLNPGTAAETWALVRTGRYAWGESGDVQDGTEMAWDEGEVRGPVTLAVSAEQPSEGGSDRTTRIFVSGDSSFAANQYLSLSANRNLILNAIGWLAAQDDKVAIRPRRRGANLLVLSPGQREGIAFFVLYALPVMLLSLGLGIWLVRRQR
ncbi:MAG: Gldg family protein, partial [Myxococcota bacterium]